MSEAGWKELLGELRRIRAESTRSEEEIWNALDEIRDLLVARGEPGPSGSGGIAPSARTRPREQRSEYRRLRRELRSFLVDALPRGASVAVVSKGDEEMIRVPELRTEHFPRALGGGYAGFYPCDGTAVIAHLEWVRSTGVEYLVFPETSEWWLDSYPKLRTHLERTCRLADREPGVGTVYDLRAPGHGTADGWQQVAELLDAWEDQLGSVPAVLDWNTGADLATRLPGRSVFMPPAGARVLPYLAGTVELVAVKDGEPTRTAEALRVAQLSVLRCADRELRGIQHRNGGPPPLPRASIVIPTYNGVRHLVPCVRALASTLGERFAGEVLIVDDGGTPDTQRVLRELEQRHAWLRVVRNAKNQGFIAACNRGAEEASGDVLVFLNDDTIPLPGWLYPLLRTFRARPDAGAVGGRLLYPDGRLQEAGGVIFRDGSGANFGRDDHEPDAPPYTHVRAVQYCSGALLATPRDLFRRLGGFDAMYRPAYYEDTDYCFSVRASGRTVYYQPESVVVHLEGATSGTDLTSGAKRHQVRNRETFRAKWRSTLGRLPEPPTRYSRLVWQHLLWNGGAA
jgi:GT2 family glycosyltransferase